MAIKDRTELKQYFQTNKRPTQSQFADLIDSTALVGEIPVIPVIPTKPYKIFSALLSTENISTEIGNPRIVINYTLLEPNEIGEMRFSLRENLLRITGDFPDLSKLFIISGLLNDSCNFDKIIFSWNDSIENELTLYFNTDPRDLVASFTNLPIEIRVYRDI